MGGIQYKCKQGADDKNGDWGWSWKKLLERSRLLQGDCVKKDTKAMEPKLQ